MIVFVYPNIVCVEGGREGGGTLWIAIHWFEHNLHMYFTGNAVRLPPLLCGGNTRKARRREIASVGSRILKCMLCTPGSTLRWLHQGMQ